MAVSFILTILLAWGEKSKTSTFAQQILHHNYLYRSEYVHALLHALIHRPTIDKEYASHQDTDFRAEYMVEAEPQYIAKSMGVSLGN